jgi:hypothetical protein
VSFDEHNTAPVRLVKIGHGGWSIDWGAHSSTRGYGQDWREYVTERPHPDGVTIIDLTVAPFERLTELSVRGPMLDITLAPGLVRKLGGGTLPFKADEARGYLGNAGGLDYVAIDVYANLARQIGAAVVHLAPGDAIPERFEAGEVTAPPAPEPPKTSNASSCSIEDLLPEGWETDGMGLDSLLTCPHGYEIEQDGRCPKGCVSPLAQLI